MMDLHFLKDFLPLAALYPELHYRFRAFPFSRYYTPFPEIIADAPRRLEPGAPLPVLIIVKDSDRFPVVLREIEIIARRVDVAHRHFVSLGGTLIHQRWWHHLEMVALPREAGGGEWQVEVFLSGEAEGKRFRVRNDNLPGLSHAPLKVQDSGCALPRESGWHYGDIHAHTAFTEDQVEFGAPLEAYPVLGSAAGLSFAATMDHSYDLDDLPGSFFRNDPQLQRFRFRNAVINRLNEEYAGRFCLLEGYELSAGNAKGRNVHLLLINQDEFLPGAGDSAERWLRRRPDLTLSQALRTKSGGSLALAAHPGVHPPILERLLLNRGRWTRVDLDQESLDGLQVWNGRKGIDFERGLRMWVEGLLGGKRWKIFAGSDAHGNFNRYRQVKTPMLRLEEDDRHTFGKTMTCVYVEGDFGERNLMEALRSGRSFITDGPWADLEAIRPTEKGWEVRVRALSTPEFGEISEIRLFWGREGITAEETFEPEVSAALEMNFPFILDRAGGYLRLQARTCKGNCAYTNPLYLQREGTSTLERTTQASR